MNSLKRRRICDNLSPMLKIRLQRVGRKHEPSFRLVLTDTVNSTKSGRFNEILGSYDPRKLGQTLKSDRIKHWLDRGANPTSTVANLLIKTGIMRGKKVHVGADYKAPTVESTTEPSPETAASDTIEEAAPAPLPAAETQPE